MKETELLACAAAALDTLIGLNSGVVHAATAKFSLTTGSAPTQVISVCPVGCAYSDPHTAIRSVAGDYSKYYIFQIAPGVYNGAIGIADFNGEIDGTGASRGDTVIEATGARPQAILRIGSMITPYPGSHFKVSNITINGTLATGAKQSRCVQVQSAGVIQFNNVEIDDCQMGILGQDWTPTDGHGVIIVSGSGFKRNGSNNGPSHPIYVGFGTLCVGQCNLTVNGTTYVGVGNEFWDVNYGYGTKSRAKKTIVSHNVYNMGTVLADSGAVHIAEGGSALIADNVMNFGTLTGTNAQPPQAILLGGILGQFVPWNIQIQGNKINLNGVTKPFTPISSLLSETGVNVSSNVFPAANALGKADILAGPGTIGTGNIYGDGASVTPRVQNTSINGSPVLADYRGTSTPQSVTITTAKGGQTVWGGGGLLTVSMAGKSNGAYVIGGPGGVNFSQVQTSNPAWVWTDPASVQNTISLTRGFQTLDYGKNDTITVGGAAPGGNGNPINVLAGATTVNIDTSQATQNPNTMVKVMGASATINDAFYNSANVDVSVDAWPGSTVRFRGTGVRPTFGATNSTIDVDTTLTPASGASMRFVHTIEGGGITSGPLVVANGGTVKAMSGWGLTSYNSSLIPPVIRLKESTSVPYTFNAVGGGTLYAGIDQVSLTGNGLALGPAPLPVVWHIEGSAAGSSINALFSPQSIFLDGPGTALIKRANKSTQPTQLEMDVNGSGSVEVTAPWRNIDACVLNGVSITSQGAVGSNYVIHVSSGGTAQFDRMKAVSCSVKPVRG
jgi:hypothetical protein